VSDPQMSDPTLQRDHLGLVSSGPDVTRALGAALAAVLEAGDVVLLGGDLGAGKTTFTQGVAWALGVRDTVTSPTFTLVRDYPTGAGFRLLHADVYRLEQLQEVLDLALPEQLEDGAIALIEWGEKAAPALGPDALSVRLDHGDADDERRLTFRTLGDGWGRRFPWLVARLRSVAGAAVATEVGR
jgi:tRNA threonylcarbamoyladenosine biosynthesis protein TsaE